MNLLTLHNQVISKHQLPDHSLDHLRYFPGFEECFDDVTKIVIKESQH